MTVGIAGVLCAAVLGWLAAGAAGLTGTETAAQGVLEPSPHRASDRPSVRDTVEVPVPPALPTEESPTPVEVAAAAAPAAVAPSPQPQPTPAPPPAPRPTPVPTVHPGDSCSAEGQPGRFPSGKRAECTASNGNGGIRWRAA